MSNTFCNYMPNSRKVLPESKKHMLTKVVHGILIGNLFRACPCALKKKNNKVKIMLEQDVVKQPFLKLYAKLKELQTKSKNRC